MSTWNPFKPPQKTSCDTAAHIHTVSVRTHANTRLLTRPIASAIDSTMPPTMPPSLAASFKVTMMSSTASFISWAASEMASWVCDAWGHSELINVCVTPSCFGQKKIYQLDNCSGASLQLARTQRLTRGHFTSLASRCRGDDCLI